MSANRSWSEALTDLTLVDALWDDAPCCEDHHREFWPKPASSDQADQ